MKHIFLIHSNITYLSALGVICKNELREEDVLVISKYDIGIDKPIQTHYLRSPYKTRWMFNPNKYVDSFIKKHIGNESYIAYLEAMTFIGKIVVSNPKCVGFHFIEEGSSSMQLPELKWLTYDEQNELDTPLRYDGCKRRLKDIIQLLSGLSIRTLGLPYMPHAYYHVKGTYFYGFGKDAFEGANVYHELSWKSITNRYTFNKRYNLNNSVIWLSTTPEHGNPEIINVESYIHAIENKLIPHLKSHGISHIFIKFHPVELIETKEKEMELFRQNGIDFEIIDDRTLMEIELMDTDGITIYCVMTSLVKYALQMGVKNIYSIANSFPGYRERDGTNLWDHVTLL